MAPSNKKSGKVKLNWPPASLNNMPRPTIGTNIAPAPTTPVLRPSISSTTTAQLPLSNFVDFETFLDLADVGDIIRFCNTAASTQDGQNLKLLWDCAFEAGCDEERMESRRSRDEERKESYFQGKAQGIEKAEAAASHADIDLYTHGTAKGRAEE